MMKNKIKNLTNTQKFLCLVCLTAITILITIGIPTLARFNNRNTLSNVTLWDGTTATKFKSGTGLKDDPFVISNGNELSYFKEQLKTNNFFDKYIILSNDIKLNEGFFKYDELNKSQYILDKDTYYIKDYTNNYYSNADYIGAEVGHINKFEPLDGFKGHFNGNSFTIFGLYLSDETAVKQALFTNLKGDVTDLYVTNTLINGGTIVGGISSNTNVATIKNVMFDGNVIAKAKEETHNIPINNQTFKIAKTESTNKLLLKNNIPNIGATIKRSSITGNYSINNSNGTETNVKLNGVILQNGIFNIDLEKASLNELDLITSTTSNSEVTITFSNIVYNMVYDYSIAGGIIGLSDVTTISNSINKANIYGGITSGGIIGTNVNSLNIENSYNTGNISAVNTSGGIIGVNEKNDNTVLIKKSYNTGSMSSLNHGGLLGLTDNSEKLSIVSSFNTSQSKYTIGTITKTKVDISNSYYTTGEKPIFSGTATGSFVLQTIEQIKNNSFIKNNLLYNEFNSFDDINIHPENVWVLDEGNYPILYIDDLNNPVAKIYTSIYSWDNLSSKLNTFKFNDNISFSIEETKDLVPLKDISYYISNSKVPLSKEELNAIVNWTPYTKIEQILTDGSYIIYAKLIDQNNNIRYINTDLLMLNTSGPSASIKLKETRWTGLKNNLKKLYTDKEEKVEIITNDLSGEIKTLKYFNSNKTLSIKELNEIKKSSWINYSEPITINRKGNNTIYVQIEDKYGYISYLNTDYIVYGGYKQESLHAGRNSTSYKEPEISITDKSTVTLNFTYNEQTVYQAGYTHNLISNILLPLGTKITLIDNTNDKVYNYEILTTTDIFNYETSCPVDTTNCVKKATIPFTLFSEIGTPGNDKHFVENTYFSGGYVKEDFKIVIDFKESSNTKNYENVKLTLTLNNFEGKSVRPTLANTIKTFNIYNNVNNEPSTSKLTLSTNYNGNEILMNETTTTNIELKSVLEYKKTGTKKIIDTTHENMNTGIKLEIMDANNKIVSKENLENINFKIGNNIFYPEKDGITRINLGSEIENNNSILSILTFENNTKLPNGIYNLNITNYLSFGGNYPDATIGNTIKIPLKVESRLSNITYNFNVSTTPESKIISKKKNEAVVPLTIIQNGTLNNPIIRLSLYKKDLLTAFNQNYSIVNINMYLKEPLTLFKNNIFNLITNPLQYDGTELSKNKIDLKLNTTSFENTGYKFVVYLYDGNKLVGTIEKYFIIK
ncbi:MAG: hypothetical protein RSB77_02230 [Bacilli bacterium]